MACPETGGSNPVRLFFVAISLKKRKNGSMRSLLDTDFYTFTVGMAAFHTAPTAQAVFEFKCRNEDVTFDAGFAMRFQRALGEADGMRFQEAEIKYLSKVGKFSDAYLDFLKNFEFDASKIVWSIDENGRLGIWVRGTWHDRMIYEVPILAMVNEAYYGGRGDLNAGRKILRGKIELIRKHNDKQINRLIKFTEFGTRRRYSFNWQCEVLQTLQQEIPENLVGTSNVYLSRTFGIPVIGTQSHQWYQAFQALVPVKDSLKAALDAWLMVHRGRYATALTDIVGSKAFYGRMEPLHWKAFDGFRGDSGDNEWWLNLTKEALLDADVDPQTKKVYLSNGLDVPESLDLFDDYSDTFRELNFAIGTKFTNHFPHKALNIVMKMTELNGAPVAKLSDDAGKGMCKDEVFLASLKKTFA